MFSNETVPDQLKASGKGGEARQISIPSKSVLSRIRKIFNRYEYTEKAIQDSMKSYGSAPITNVDNTTTPVEILINLFVRGVVVETEDLSSILKPVDIEEWTKAGLIQVNNAKITSLITLMPHQGLLIASDKNWGQIASTDREVVMGLTSSTTYLSELTIRRASRSTLDLGTGTGIQALLAAKHSEEVIAVDINPRALAFARFNAELNEITNVEFIEGDMFGPVKDRKFDLILCNPPFSVSPDFHCLYRDNPLEGDEFVSRLVRKIPEYLQEGGYGQIICNWEEHADCQWETRLSDWVTQKNCDAWILRSSSRKPTDYTRVWVNGFDPADTEKLTEDWLSFYAMRNVTSIGGGIITLRRSEQNPNWLRIDRVQPKILTGAETHIKRGFQLRDFVNTRLKDEVLRKDRFRVSPHLLLDQRHQPNRDGWRPVGAQLTLTKGFAFKIQLEPDIVKLIIRCDGKQSIGELLTMIAIDKQEAALQKIRKLIAFGFLWPEVFCDVQPIKANTAQSQPSPCEDVSNDTSEDLLKSHFNQAVERIPVHQIVGNFLDHPEARS